MYCFCYFLGSQLNVHSDDEDTPFEDDDDDDSQSDIDVTHSHLSSSNSADVRFIRQPSPIPKTSNFVSEKNQNKLVTPDFVCKQSRFSRGHLCLKCKEKPGLGLCNLCKNHWYCSTSCQIKDWPEHQKKCTKESNRKRTTPVIKSNLIKFPIPSDLFLSLEQKSKSQSLKQTGKSTNCIKCRQNLPYFLCAECKNFWYCSHKCHSDHWEEHKKFCSIGKWHKIYFSTLQGS